MPNGPSSNLLMAQAVLFWVVAWWLADLTDGEPMGTAVACICAVVAMGLAIGSVSRAVPQPSPFSGVVGQIAWALRPRKWMIFWSLIVALFIILGRPMILNIYGGGRCQYIDWWLRAHILPSQGDGAFQGCRFLAGW